MGLFVPLAAPVAIHDLTNPGTGVNAVLFNTLSDLTDGDEIQSVGIVTTEGSATSTDCTLEIRANDNGDVSAYLPLSFIAGGSSTTWTMFPQGASVDISSVLIPSNLSAAGAMFRGIPIQKDDMRWRTQFNASNGSTTAKVDLHVNHAGGVGNGCSRWQYRNALKMMDAIEVTVSSAFSNFVTLGAHPGDLLLWIVLKYTKNASDIVFDLELQMNDGGGNWANIEVWDGSDAVGIMPVGLGGANWQRCFIPANNGAPVPSLMVSDQMRLRINVTSGSVGGNELSVWVQTAGFWDRDR